MPDCWQSSGLAQNPAAPKPAGSPAGLKDLKQKASYSYGYTMGRSLKSQGIDLDARAIAQGLADAIGGGAAAMQDQEMQACLQAFARQIQAKQAGMAGKAAATNKIEGERFLAAEQDPARRHHVAQRPAIQGREAG